MENAATLASSIYGRLRRDILTGVFRPTEKLRLEALSERYAVGTTPLREALNRLSAEDLVLREEQRGFRVAPVSLRDLAELTDTLGWIVELALVKSIANGDAAWEEGVVLAAHKLSRIPQGSVAVGRPFNPEWEQRHRDYHLALIGACGSRWLIGFYAMLMDRCDRYLYLAAAEPPWALRDSAAEHRAITEAVLARDVPRAVERSHIHIQRTAEAVARSKTLVLASLGGAPAGEASRA